MFLRVRIGPKPTSPGATCVAVKRGFRSRGEADTRLGSRSHAACAFAAGVTWGSHCQRTVSPLSASRATIPPRRSSAGPTAECEIRHAAQWLQALALGLTAMTGSGPPPAANRRTTSVCSVIRAFVAWAGEPDRCFPRARQSVTFGAEGRRRRPRQRPPGSETTGKVRMVQPVAFEAAGGISGLRGEFR
jgi:hypothetical protein